MKKIADFLVNRRYIILAVFLVIAAISVFLMGKVNVNHDMTKYLPDDSYMKIGMDIMEKEFGEEDSSSLKIMFSGLSEEEETKAYDYLSTLKNVESVDFDADSIDYHKDGYTLYVLHTELDAYSDAGAKIYDTVKETYSDSEIYFSGEIASANEPMLPAYIIAAALLILIAVLFIMSDSWFEPVIFLANIGVAIVINMGTNAFLPSVSDTTNSVVAILQLVLSMDYSIILMNRYTQEKSYCGSNTDAMKNAVANAFSSITSSSLTTFVGLLALVFMSFKIGADMGIALAKSVLISLICIFTVLPSLILMSDKLITKLHKKSLHIPMGGYAKFTSKCRFGIGGAMVCIFAVFAVLKGGTEITYTLDSSNKVDEIFPPENQIVMLYDKKDSSAAETIAAELEKDEKVNSVTGYYNTLGIKYTSDELAKLVEEMGESSMDSSMLKLVYYQYYAGNTDLKVNISDMLAYISGDTFSDMIDEDTQSQIEMLARFTDESAITAPLGAAELSAMLGLEEQTVSQLMQLSGAEKMSLKDLTNFLINDVLSNPDYAPRFGQEETQQFYTLQSVMSMAGAEFTAAEFAQGLSGFSEEFDENTAKLLYLSYGAENNYDEAWTMSLPEMIDYIAEDLMQDSLFAGYFDEDAKNSIADVRTQLAEGAAQLEGENYGRIILSTAYAEDSEETRAFMEKINTMSAEQMTEEYYLIGNSSMSYEMSQTFDGEMNKITLITAAAIFIVVALTFRSLLIPLILVLIVQCGVFATMTFIGISGGSIYYLALLIVQCILMGATIDYGILFTNYYRSHRKAMGIREALSAAYDGSLHTILTSSLIMIMVTGILGLTLSDPTIGAICLTIAEGALCATILILFLLPGLLASVDKVICSKK